MGAPISGVMYEVAIHLTAINGVSGVLAGISKEVLGLTASVKELEKGFSSLRLGVIGATGVAAGLGGFAVLKDAAVYAGDLSHELTQIRKLGLDSQQFGQVRDAARALTNQVAGVTEKGALETYGAAYSIFGHEEAISLMKPMAQFVQVVGNTTGDYEKAEKGLYAMVRSADLMGQLADPITRHIDPERLKHFLSLGAQVSLMTHGRVDADTWLGLAQQGGPALSSMTDSGLMTMAIAAQAMSGLRAGTALASFYQQMVGGKMTQYSAQELERLKLVGPFDVGRGGHLLWRDGSLKTAFTQALQQDPLQGVMVMKEAMEKAGVTDMESQRNELFQLLGRATTQRLVHDLLRNTQQILAEKLRTGEALGIDQSLSVQSQHDLGYAQHNLGVAKQNFMYAFADPGTGVFITAIKGVTGALNMLTNWARGADPNKIRNLFEAFALASAGLFAAGTLSIVMAIAAALGPAGLVVAGLTAFAAAIAYLKSLFSGSEHGDDVFDRAHKPAEDLFQIIRKWPGELLDAMADFGRFMENAAKSIGAAIMGIASAIGNEILNIPSSVGKYIAGLGSRIAAAISAVIMGRAHDALPGGGALPIAPQSYRGPPAAPRPTHTIQVRGDVYTHPDKIGAVVWRASVRASDHPVGAPAFDHFRSWGDPGGNFEA